MNATQGSTENQTNNNIAMKTKLTLFAAMILVGFSATIGSATPTNWSFANGQMEASAKPAGS
jgi:hypothetical protein